MVRICLFSFSAFVTIQGIEAMVGLLRIVTGFSPKVKITFLCSFQ